MGRRAGASVESGTAGTPQNPPQRAKDSGHNPARQTQTRPSREIKRMSIQNAIATKDETPVTIPYWTLVALSGATKALLDLGAGSSEQRSTMKMARMIAHRDVDKQLSARGDAKAESL